MPDRIRLQQRASAAVSQSHDLSIRAHGADSAPGEHTAAFRGVNGAGVEGLTGARRALSHGVSSLGAGRGDHIDPSPGKGGVCARKSDRGVLPDPHTASRIDQIGAGVCIVLVLACALLGGDVWIARLLIAWGLA
jgi:hypothetical protein